MKAQPTHQNESTLVPLIVDTNIIINSVSTNADLRKKTQDFLGLLAQNGYLLCINEITYYECFKKANPARQKEFVEYLKAFHTYTIDSLNLAVGADLYSIYANNEILKGKLSMSTEDVLIASTSWLTRGYILTQNCLDFPPPFFDCIYKHLLIYEDKTIDKMVVNYLLRADYVAIKDANDEWCKTKGPKPRS